MDPLYIGISGVSRSGKDSLAIEIEKIIRAYIGNVFIYKSSLAQPLKEDCAAFIKNHLNLNVFTDKTEEKSIFREFLVWYGKVKRQQSEGKHWTNLLDERIKNFQPDICIVPDIRYQQYRQDEVNWLKSKNRNVLIHLQRIAINGEIVQPANMDESINDSILQDMADYKIVWPTFIEDGKDECMREIAIKAFNTVIKEKI
jgi:hypothetical protein